MRKLVVTLLTLAILGAGGIFIYLNYFTRVEPSLVTQPQQETGKREVKEKWVKEKGIRIPGRYADAEVVELDNGRYRMYYSVEPEVPGNKLEMYSAISEDGLNWKREKGIRMTFRTFPDVVRLSDGRWRMYYQNQGVIQSSSSKDGLNWSEEEGIRIKRGLQGKYDTKNVAASTTIQLSDGSYLMVYRGSAGENKFGQKDPVDNKLRPIDYLICATSKDGLKWKADKILVDSDNQDLRDQVDGPELIYDGNILKLYYWSFPGVHVKESTDHGKSWSESKLVIKSSGPNYAPGDPSVIKQGNTWRMYFGLHTKGIHSAKLTK